MSPLTVLLVGTVVVVGGVLWLRLHAFVALILAALAVAMLTPRDAVYEHELRSQALLVETVDVEAGQLALRVERGQRTIEGKHLVLRQADDGSKLHPLGHVLLERFAREPASNITRAFVQISVGEVVPLRSGDRLIHYTLERAAAGSADETIGERVAAGFGDTCLKIGILIAMAAIIGKCLLDSGAAERIVRSTRNLLGDRRAPIAFVASGFLVGIPVFFDTVFYLLMPLGKALRVQTGKDYLLYVLTITCGATMAHSLVPPTPGPLFVASELGVDIGLMMLGGSVVGIAAATAGYLFALWANRRWQIPLRPSAELTTEQLEAMARRDERDLPPLAESLLPILLPVVLIGGDTVLDMALGAAPDSRWDWLAQWKPLMSTVGNKNVALLFAAAISVLTLLRQKHLSRAELASRVQTALAGGGVIILITAAGGAFGHVLRQTGISHQIQQLVPVTQLGILPLAFAITAVIRAAQGSGTVSMITAVGIVAPLASGAELGFHPLYLALAIGCGSKPLPWMNDSGFWIICRMSGMTEAETLKTHAVNSTLMGCVGLVVTMICASAWPLV